MLKSLKCVVQCLEHSVSPDKNVLAEAQLKLEKCAQKNMGQFISNLSIVIEDQKSLPEVRQAASLQLKTCLTVKDAKLNEQYHEGWTNLPKETRIVVRDRLISTLGTENTQNPSCAAQCLAYIMAAGFFPETQASSGMASLECFLSEVSDMVRQPAKEHRIEAAFESIAFICQEISVQNLVYFNRSILDPILFCMAGTNRTRTRSRSKLTGRIRLAAARALLSSLKCISKTFDTEEGRKTIMEVVCDAAQSSVVEESVISLEILVTLVSLYYHHIKIEMESNIVPIISNAMASPVSDIVLQGMKFWHSVAKIEHKNMCDHSSSSRFKNNVLHKILPSVLTSLVNGLLVHLEDDDHRVAAAACKTLSSLARIIYRLTSEKEEDRPLLVTPSWPQYYERTVDELMQCCGKFRGNQKCAAQEALLDVLLSSPRESYETVKRTIQTLIGKLCDGDAAADENYLPCTMLLRAMGRLRGHIQIHHEFMRKLISILKSESPRGVLKDKKDAFLATSKTISLWPFDELKLHMLDLTTYLSSAIELPDPCPMVMSLIGDLFYEHSLFRKSLRYLDDFWLKFVDILARKDLHTKSRSICVATLNKMAHWENFSPYIVRTLKQLENAPSITVNQDPEHEELQENMLNLYYHLFKLTHNQVTQSRENRKQELDSQLSMMEKCLAGFSELMVAIVDEDTSDKIIIESAEHVGNILLELGIDEATKYLKSNLNLKWLLTSAAQRINSKEKNHNSSLVYSLHEALTLFTEEMPCEHAQSHALR